MNMLAPSLRKPDGETLVKQYFLHPNQKSKESVILAFLPLVKYIIGRMKIPNTGFMNKEDIYQYGIIGLLDALERFEPNYGVGFKTFAYKRIRGEILDAVRREGVFNKEQLHDYMLIVTTRQKLSHVLGREPSSVEVCEATGITEKRFNQLREINGLNFMASLDEPLGLNDGETLTRKDIIQDTDRVTPDKAFDLIALRVELKNVIQSLPERQRLILALYYYEEITFKDIGQVLGVSESRISQIMNQTIKDIKKQMDL